MPKKLTSEEFITRAQKVHSHKYDYSKVKYVNSHTKVCIVCPIHGEFWQMPSDHLNGHGCAKCRTDKVSSILHYTLDDFIGKAKKVHGDRYDYSKVVYINSQTKVCIICPKHGEFLQKPNSHLLGMGCRKCADEEYSAKHSSNTDEFIQKAILVHGNKYDYSKVKYVNNRKQVCIICPIHGEFWQTPHSHLSGNNCPKCGLINAANNRKLTKNEFIEQARKIHGIKYDYSKTEYVGIMNKICIVCPKHGEFLQVAHDHLRGNGCPLCQRSKLEEEILTFLIGNTTECVCHKRFDWLGTQELDIYLPKYNAAIECQGEQHFEPTEYFGGEEAFKYRLELDERKRKLCEEHGIKLFYYSNLGIKYPYQVYEDKEELLNEIKRINEN